MRRKLIELKQQRTAQLEAAETALKAGKQEDYNSAMEQVQNMNGDCLLYTSPSPRDA